MNIAIYPRKSKFSPTSESIANQVAMCREYCDRCFDDPHYLVYDEDEGFSGKSTNRPAYTQMIEDMRAGKFQVLCCYRLDRISRNVRDFAELLDDLQRHNIAFVSVRNNFDTSTPFGRAMVYISSALAQIPSTAPLTRRRGRIFHPVTTSSAPSGRILTACAASSPLPAPARTMAAPSPDRLATGLSRPDCTAESFRAPYGCAPSRSFKTTVIWAAPTEPRAPKTRCYRASSAAPAALCRLPTVSPRTPGSTSL